MPKPKRCPRCRRRPPRAPDQSLCSPCHAKDSKAYRLKKRKELDALLVLAKRYGEAL